jgi:hypothetical protein
MEMSGEEVGMLVAVLAFVVLLAAVGSRITHIW